MLSCFSRVRLRVTPRTAVHQVLPSKSSLVRILEWVAMPSSSGCSQPRGTTCIFTTEPPGKPRGRWGLLNREWHQQKHKDVLNPVGEGTTNQLGGPQAPCTLVSSPTLLSIHHPTSGLFRYCTLCLKCFHPHSKAVPSLTTKCSFSLVYLFIQGLSHQNVSNMSAETCSLLCLQCPAHGLAHSRYSMNFRCVNAEGEVRQQVKVISSISHPQSWNLGLPHHPQVLMHHKNPCIGDY